MTTLNLMKMAESSPDGLKTLWEKKKLLVTSNFSFSHSGFKSFLRQTRKNQGLFGKGLRTGGCWFDPGLNQYSFRGWMKVIATGFIPLSLLSVVLTMVMWGKQPVAWKDYCVEYWCKRTPG